jgi:alpha-1,6-mannosyltransferase
LVWLSNSPSQTMQKTSKLSTAVTTSGLLLIAVALGIIFKWLSRHRPLKNYVPEFIALMLLAGILYLAAVYIVQRSKGGFAALLIILAASVIFRLFFLSLSPTLSDDVYRYQWEGRIVRAGINPYGVYPAMPQLGWAQNPGHPVETGRSTPTLYPPLCEAAFAGVQTVAGYKRLFTALDLASVALILFLLAATQEPLQRVLIYAWNPAVLIAFAASGHNDSLATLMLLAAILFIIGRRRALSIAFLALAALSKLFPVFLLPAFLKRTRWSYAGIFGGLVLLGYLPFLRVQGHLFQGLSDFAGGWEGNDSLFRILLMAGNSKGQAQLVAGVLLQGLIVYALKMRADIFRVGLVIITGLILLSPNAFPWYFTWVVPFLCFAPRLPLLLLTVTCVLGYSPVIAYAAGGSFQNMPMMLILEYLPVYAWLAFEASRGPKMKLKA